MGSSRKKRGKKGSQSRIWDDWQRYVKKETQRVKQKPGGQVVEVRFPGRKPAAPPEEPPLESRMPAPEQQEGRRPPVPGVTREEALQVSDDEIGRTVRPFTVEDYRGIRPLNSPDLFESDSEEAVSAGPVTATEEPAFVETVIQPVEDIPPPAPPEETKPGKRRGRKKKSGGIPGDGELELFDSVSEHQTVTRQRLTRKSRLDREELIEKLLDPVISLEEASTLIGVCKTTVRRYTNKGELECLRTPGQQRRFRLSHVLAFVKRREEDQKTRRGRKKKES